MSSEEVKGEQAGSGEAAAPQAPADEVVKVTADNGETYALTDAWVTHEGVTYVDLQCLNGDGEPNADDWVAAIKTGEGDDAEYDVEGFDQMEADFSLRITMRFDAIHVGEAQSGPLEEISEVVEESSAIVAPTDEDDEQRSSDDPGTGEGG